MSRRYGRNQKRRAREEIARLKEWNEAVERAYKRDVQLLERVLAEKRAALSAVAEALGPAFVGLPLNDLMLKVFDVADIERAPDAFQVIPPGGDGPVTMQVMKASVRDDLLRDRIHVRLSLSGSEVGYAISNAAIARSPRRFLVRQIAEQMAELLVLDFEGRGIRR